MIKLFFTHQFSKFFIVGMTAAMFNWIARYLLNTVFSFSVSILLAYCVGMYVAFILNRLFVFADSKSPLRLQVNRFILINALMLPVVWGFSFTINEILLDLYVPNSQNIAHGLALLLPSVITFLAYKFFSFK
jgi:putative flippase GtrA